MEPAVHPTLLSDMRLARLSEFGARTFYGRMRVVTRDPELARLLTRLWEEEQQLVQDLGQLMTAIGGRPAVRSRRRWLAAQGLVLTTYLFGSRFALRICQHAEETVGRWYLQYAQHLAQVGLLGEAQQCDEMAAIKRLHSQALGAWVQNIRRFRR